MMQYTGRGNALAIGRGSASACAISRREEPGALVLCTVSLAVLLGGSVDLGFRPGRARFVRKSAVSHCHYCLLSSMYIHISACISMFQRS